MSALEARSEGESEMVSYAIDIAIAVTLSEGERAEPNLTPWYLDRLQTQPVPIWRSVIYLTCPSCYN